VLSIRIILSLTKCVWYGLERRITAVYKVDKVLNVTFQRLLIVGL